MCEKMLDAQAKPAPLPPEVKALAEAAERAVRMARHSRACPKGELTANPCSCGLSELEHCLAAVNKPLDGKEA